MCGERCLCTRFCLAVVEVRNHRAIPSAAPRRPTPLWILPTFLHQVASSQVAIILRPTTEKRHPRPWSGRRYYSQAATLNAAPVDGALAGGPLAGVEGWGGGEVAVLCLLSVASPGSCCWSLRTNQAWTHYFMVLMRASGTEEKAVVSSTVCGLASDSTKGKSFFFLSFF